MALKCININSTQIPISFSQVSALYTEIKPLAGKALNIYTFKKIEEEKKIMLMSI